MDEFIKKNMIILSLGIFMLASFFFLALTEKNQRDLDLNKNWWSLYFEDPQESSLDFTIENHSDSEDFHWETYLEKSKTFEQDVRISKGESRKISVSSMDLENKKVLIRVSNGVETKEIYKIINK